MRCGFRTQKPKRLSWLVVACSPVLRRTPRKSWHERSMYARSSSTAWSNWVAIAPNCTCKLFLSALEQSHLIAMQVMSAASNILFSKSLLLGFPQPFLNGRLLIIGFVSATRSLKASLLKAVKWRKAFSSPFLLMMAHWLLWGEWMCSLLYLPLSFLGALFSSVVTSVTVVRWLLMACWKKVATAPTVVCIISLCLLSILVDCCFKLWDEFFHPPRWKHVCTPCGLAWSRVVYAVLYVLLVGRSTYCT